MEQVADTFVHTFTVTRKSDNFSRTVTLLHYPAWPDFDSPDSFTSVIAFMATYRRFRDADTFPVYDQKTNKYPVLAHCSAGVGRTGTFIAMDALLDYLNAARLQSLKEAQPDIVVRELGINVFKLVAKIRSQRPRSVQTAKQYGFITDFAAYCLECSLLGLEYTTTMQPQ
jgi:protein tyrosine phosphatase